MIARKISEESELELAVAMLKLSKLPTSDLKRDSVSLYGFYEDSQLIGTGGIEHLNGFRLLRSLSVGTEYRSKGFGLEIVKFLEREVADEGIEDVYIITEIPAYFTNLEYAAIPRDQTPEVIKETQEFSVLCPDTASVMRKKV